MQHFAVISLIVLIAAGCCWQSIQAGLCRCCWWRAGGGGRARSVSWLLTAAYGLLAPSIGGWLLSAAAGLLLMSCWWHWLLFLPVAATTVLLPTACCCNWYLVVGCRWLAAGSWLRYLAAASCFSQMTPATKASAAATAPASGLCLQMATSAAGTFLQMAASADWPSSSPSCFCCYSSVYDDS